MDETKLDESTLAAQRQEAERLRRVIISSLICSVFKIYFVVEFILIFINDWTSNKDDLICFVKCNYLYLVIFIF